MLFDLSAWQAACVQVIKREAEARCMIIRNVFKAATGTWYVRVQVMRGEVCTIRLADHRSSQAQQPGNWRLLSIRRGATGRLRSVGAWLDAVADRVGLRP